MGAKGGEAMCIVGPSLHKAGKAKRFGGKIGKVIKRMGRDSLREFRYKGRRRWVSILDIRCEVSSIEGR